MQKISQRFRLLLGITVSFYERYCSRDSLSLCCSVQNDIQTRSFFFFHIFIHTLQSMNFDFTLDLLAVTLGSYLCTVRMWTMLFQCVQYRNTQICSYEGTLIHGSNAKRYVNSLASRTKLLSFMYTIQYKGYKDMHSF